MAKSRPAPKAKRPTHSPKPPSCQPATREDIEELFRAILYLVSETNRRYIHKLMKLSEYSQRIAAAQAELVESNAEIAKAQTEIVAATQAQNDLIQQLKDQLADAEIPQAAQDTLTSLEASAADLKAKADALDALNADTETPPSDGGDTGNEPPTGEPQTLGARRAAKAKK